MTGLLAHRVYNTTAATVLLFHTNHQRWHQLLHLTGHHHHNNKHPSHLLGPGRNGGVIKMVEIFSK
ncbi:MAG TPA: hypothetical protein VKA91_02680 [Nitrososphaeraceae archaeon]|nr:hypothetical protein [Nitrososphaeraceae archaeon]